MLHIGPDVTITYGKTVPLMVSCDTSGVVSITSTPGVIHNDNIMVDGKAVINCTFNNIGTYTITATKGTETDSCIVKANIDKCLVHGTIVDILGNPLRNSEILIEPCNNIVGYSVVASRFFTNHMGHFSARLLRGIEVVIQAKQASYKKRILVPNQDSVNITEL